MTIPLFEVEVDSVKSKWSELISPKKAAKPSNESAAYLWIGIGYFELPKGKFENCRS